MEKIYIFGTGSGAIKFYKSLKKDSFCVKGFIDNNSEKWGNLLFGLEIFKPETLQIKEYDKIIICSRAYHDIRKKLINELNISMNKIDNFLYESKLEMTKYYMNDTEDEKKEILDYLKNNELDVFNYKFVSKYREMDIAIHFDQENLMFYYSYGSKRMYLKMSIDTREKAVEYVRGILMEQDEKSPHKYLTESFNVYENAIVIDAGTAEGNFTLDIIDRVKKVYLVEADEEWMQALKLTFSMYKDKVVFVNKFLSDLSAGNSITIDEMIQNNKIDFIKMDIEGSEVDSLLGARNTLSKNDVGLAICAYHNEEDENKIKSFCEPLGYQFETSKGYMVFVYSKQNRPEEPLRMVRGILRGRKKKNI